MAVAAIASVGALRFNGSPHRPNVAVSWMPWLSI